jgi:hypothetical protein
MNIIDLADGEAVKGPGLYRCEMRHYHSQDICPGPSLSSSGMRKIVAESPYHFWMQSDLNSQRFPEKDPGPGLVLGRAAHSLILGDEVFDEHFAFLPEDAPQRPTSTQVAAFERDGFWSEAAKPRAEFWTEFDKKAQGKLILTGEQMAKIVEMKKSIERSPGAVEALTGQLTEISMIWQDEATGVWLKSRPDVIPSNGADFADLKTFAPQGKNIKRAVHRAISDHRYDMQMALAVMGAEVVMGVPTSECVLVMVQTTEPYTCSMVKLDEEALYWGRVWCRHAIDTFAMCMEAGHWPQPVEGIMEYTVPDGLMHRYGEMQINGDLPSMERKA